MDETIQKVKDWYRQLPDKKRYLEFISAALSIPVLITVIIINLNNLNQNKSQSATKNTGTATPVQIVITGSAPQEVPVIPTSVPVASPTATLTPTQASCKTGVGPVSIASPLEGEVTSKNPLCITISTDSTYCPITWSYAINGSSWSDFTDKDICLYNLTNGSKLLQVQLKSGNGDSVTLQRSFTYQGAPVTPTVATSSASL